MKKPILVNVSITVRNPILHHAPLENTSDEIALNAPRDENITLSARLLPVQGGLRLLNARY